MGNFFKTLGKGILYIFGLPLLVVFLAVYLVISVFGFIITGIKALILFFKGESITGKLPEDEEAEKRMELLLNPIPAIMEQVEEVKKQIANQQNMIGTNPVQGEIPQQTPEQISEQPVVAPIAATSTNKQEATIETTPIFQEEPKEEVKTVVFEEDLSNVVSEDEIPTTEIDIKPTPKSQVEINDDYFEDEESSSGVSFEEYDGEDK